MKISNVSKSLALVTPLASGVLGKAEAAAYLKIGDIKGESQVAGFEGYIKIGFFKVEIDGVGARGDESKIQFKDPRIQFPVEQASPSLMLACATGERIPSATLVLTKPTDEGGREVAYYKITMTDVLVSSYSTGLAQGESVPSENISLNFAKIEWTYSKLARNGEIEGRTSTGTISVPREP